MVAIIHGASFGMGRSPVLHCLMAAVILGIGVFALAVGAGPAFATHVGELDHTSKL